MKVFILLFGFVTVAMARPSLIQLSPQSIQTSAASASTATASSSPQRLVQLIPGLSLGSNPRLIDTLEAAAQAQAQQQQQIITGPNSLLTATRQAQSLASINPTGASSISSAQVIESPQLNAVRLAQQQALLTAAARQGFRLSGSQQPLLLGPDDAGQLVAATSPLLLA